MPEPLVSLETTLTIVVGLAIAIAYVRYMWGALERAVRTRDDADSGNDRYRFGLVGAVVAVVGSVGAIASYGAGPLFLYVGPGLALLSAVAVAYCLRTESAEDERDDGVSHSPSSARPEARGGPGTLAT